MHSSDSDSASETTPATRDGDTEALRDILIRSGVAPDRIRVGSSADLTERIAERALAIWLRDGRPPGGALRCWQEAEVLIVAEIEQGYGRRRMDMINWNQ